MIDKLNELIGKKSWFHLYCVDNEALAVCDEDIKRECNSRSKI
jgi:hypothetical protein